MSGGENASLSKRDFPPILLEIICYHPDSSRNKWHFSYWSQLIRSIGNSLAFGCIENHLKPHLVFFVGGEIELPISLWWENLGGVDPYRKSKKSVLYSGNNDSRVKSISILLFCSLSKKSVKKRELDYSLKNVPFCRRPCLKMVEDWKKMSRIDYVWTITN